MGKEHAQGRLQVEKVLALDEGPLVMVVLLELVVVFLVVVVVEPLNLQEGCPLQALRQEPLGHDPLQALRQEPLRQAPQPRPFALSRRQPTSLRSRAGIKRNMQEQHKNPAGAKMATTKCTVSSQCFLFDQ